MRMGKLDKMMLDEDPSTKNVPNYMRLWIVFHGQDSLRHNTINFAHSLHISFFPKLSLVLSR